MRTRVKICGITRLEDALNAVEAGADALGFVFYPPSPRYVEPAVAEAIIQQLPPFVTTVALFVNESDAQVKMIMDQTGIDLLQFHGDESPAFCQQFDQPYFKAVRMSADIDVTAESKRFASAKAILLDAYRAGVPGGTGEAFDWDRIPSDLELPLILAGGLDQSNVAKAICQVKPYAVDVSGGVEMAKGLKDCSKIISFMNEVACAN
ncbi:phosphoribosylanthranilate isomerase [Amphritea sp. 2_MG-2023]|uniref:phosphoribosylanthranilate isomerase n=1 Tax=Amphritea TaxID=515417 RepID=UPI001C06C305|nr:MULTISPECIES: phosphoribosylanthranilate isomerase [Amphritea]MBU2964512.1 phosphoribosylanthranilate isomerase [Amphritea atlantica]MDO6417840.1 phosphoribosylanthranilate isomerase [Amphritea sp. 2_MG-2023]